MSASEFPFKTRHLHLNRFLQLIKLADGQLRDELELLPNYDLVAMIVWRAYDLYRVQDTSFSSIVADLNAEQRRKREHGKYMFITRHTILGRYHEKKMTVFNISGYGEYLKTLPRPLIIEYLIDMVYGAKTEKQPVAK